MIARLKSYFFAIRDQLFLNWISAVSLSSYKAICLPTLKKGVAASKQHDNYKIKQPFCLPITFAAGGF
jgi:hypothetical protein